MHADAYPQPADPRADGMGRAVTYAIGLHVLFALVLWLSTQFSWERKTASAAGLPVIEASLDASASEMRAAERALQHVPEPMPQPIEEEVAEEDSVPPPQPIPEPVPDDSPVPQQTQAQERIPVPDTENQDAASRDAISQEKALREQEAKRRQEQLDLTERKRQEEAEKKQRLAKQQEEADKKKIADEKKLAADKKLADEKKLAEIRRLRAQAAKEAQLAEQKLRQLSDARARQTSAASATAASSAGSSAPQGNNGVDANLSGKYAAAIQKAVLDQWMRPDSVPRGQRCRITIRQLPGGEVVDVEVSPSCPYDDAGKRSVEAAVLRAQPLPSRGFESVFQRTLNFNFEAQDR